MWAADLDGAGSGRGAGPGEGPAATGGAAEFEREDGREVAGRGGALEGVDEVERERDEAAPRAAHHADLHLHPAAAHGCLARSLTACLPRPRRPSLASRHGDAPFGQTKVNLNMST